MSTPQAKNGTKLQFRRLSFDAERENQMSTSDRAPLFPQVPAYAGDPEHGTELQDVAKHGTILSPASPASESQVNVPIPSDLADAAGLNLNSTTKDNIVVCILIDGIKSVDPGVLAVLTSNGLYQNGLCRKTTEQGEEVTGHLFEFTSNLATHLGCEDYLDGDGNSYKPKSRSMKFPVQLMLLMKASNYGKLNSYRWLYNGFARVLDRNMTVNLDFGTKLGKQALFKLWKEFDLETMLAAACEEISCSLGGNWLNLLNPSVAAQNVEYKVGFQLDRTFKSATGFLSLRSGACSAYRYVGSSGKPLEDMLLGDPTWIQGHNRDRPALSPVNINRHLADDRVICFRIISKPNTQWLLKYVPVTATTDIPMTTTDFINQRRRWLNGAFFSTIYVLKRCGHLWRSDHTIKRKVAFFHSSRQIDSLPGPVPWRVAILLEELNIPYASKYLESDELNSEAFKSINPNAKTPAIEDPNTGIKLFEAGAIILYLLDTYDSSGSIHSLSGPQKYLELAWMQFQATEQHMYYSQQAWFLYKHPEHVQSALERYEWTIKRTIGMLEEHLKQTGKTYLTGDEITFADLCFVVTNELIPQLLPGYDPSKDFPHYARWNSALVNRPSYQKIAADRAALGQPLGQVDQKHIDDHIWRNDPDHKW
ncbi:hypothetical protein QWA68_010984 [Fusarium oxysporum]|nr:hypothetical protein QWA68_010984 [Fusarium oxysporum]